MFCSQRAKRNEYHRCVEEESGGVCVCICACVHICVGTHMPVGLILWVLGIEFRSPDFVASIFPGCSIHQHLNTLLFLNVFIHLCVCICAPMHTGTLPRCGYGSQRTACLSSFSPLTMWVLEISG